MSLTALIEYVGPQQTRDQAIALLDKSLQAHGDFGQYGNLSGGVVDVLQDMQLKITATEGGFAVEVFPLKQYGGHDFSFLINAITGEISGLVVGEVLPDTALEPLNNE